MSRDRLLLEDIAKERTFVYVQLGRIGNVSFADTLTCRPPCGLVSG